jgi:flagellar hook protein FlgE
MYAAVSGLSAHQMKMDIIGNNIANVNTVAFKGSRVTFKETFNQTVKGASGAEGGRGGTNPVQIGLGVDVGAIDVVHTRGSLERTDRATDLMINGEGFFMVSDDANALNRYYTRAGNFLVDGGGNLVTQDGFKVLGYMADETGRLKTSIEGLKIDFSAVYPPQATRPSDPPIEGEEIVTITGNLDSRTKELNKLDSTAKVIATGADKGIYNFNQARSKAAGHPIYTQENDALKPALGGTTSVKVYDDFGNIHEINLIFAKKSSTAGDDPKSTWEVHAFYKDDDGAMLIDGQTNTSYTDGKASNGSNGFKGKPITLEFDKNGNVVGDSKMPFTIGTDLTAGAAALSFEMDLSKLTQFSGKTNAAATTIKGYPQGKLDGYSISPSGEIVGAFSNGQGRVLGRIGLTNFSNPAGLQKTQSNMFIKTRNSGEPVVGMPGAGGFAQLNPGNLEMSNVNMAREFTNMITTQRGFQANSKIISTTDEMLQELVNIKR